ISSDDEDSPEWTKRRRFPLDKDPFFGDIDRIFREMEKHMEEEFREFTEKVPKDYVKERKLPDGSTVKEFGPFVYGYSMKMGPDGQPEILVDLVDANSKIRVVVELRRVEKSDMKPHGTKGSLEISVDTPQYKYY